MINSEARTGLPRIDRFYSPVAAKPIKSSNPRSCRYKAVLFDLDGTVVDTIAHICQSYQNTYRAFNLPVPSDEELMEKIGLSLWDTVSGSVPPDKREAFIAHYKSYNQSQMIENTAVFWTAKRLLDQLKGLGIPLGIVTAKGIQPALQNLHDFGLSQYFDVLVTHEDTDKHKPDPTPLLLGKEKLEQYFSRQYALEDLVYIGDSRYDVLCAQNAGIDVAVVQWTRMPVKPIEETGKFFILYDAHDLT